MSSISPRLGPLTLTFESFCGLEVIAVPSFTMSGKIFIIFQQIPAFDTVLKVYPIKQDPYKVQVLKVWKCLVMIAL